MPKLTLGALATAALIGLAAPAAAQPAHPVCTLTPAQVEANRQAGMAFFKPGITPAERIALVHPSYLQHNPVFKKAAQDSGMNDYDTFKARVGAGAIGAQPPGALALPPPAGDPYAVVTVDCDLVTVVHKAFRPLPGAAPGAWYESYTFDTFRVKDGKLIEHWDNALLPPAG